MLPNKFKFYHVGNPDFIYTAERSSEDLYDQYLVTRQGEDVLYPESEVAFYVSDDIWVIVEVEAAPTLLDRIKAFTTKYAMLVTVDNGKYVVSYGEYVLGEYVLYADDDEDLGKVLDALAVLAHARDK